MAPPSDPAQHARHGANQVMAIMAAMEENITELQQEIETLGNDLQAAHQETSTAQEEAQSMRAELMSARQEIQRLNSHLASEEASNKSLREKLRDLGNEFASFQGSFRRGTEVISAEFATQCKKLGVPCEVLTKDCDTTTDRNDSKTMQRFRAGQCKIMFTTPAGFEGIRYPKVKTAVIFSSPYECFYTDDDGPKPEVYKRRPDSLREAIESIGRAGEEATIYILVSSSTKQPVKDDIAKVLRQAGYEVPSVLRTSIRY